MLWRSTACRNDSARFGATSARPTERVCSMPSNPNRIAAAGSTMSKWPWTGTLRRSASSMIAATCASESRKYTFSEVAPASMNSFAASRASISSSTTREIDG